MHNFWITRTPHLNLKITFFLCRRFAFCRQCLSILRIGLSRKVFVFFAGKSETPPRIRSSLCQNQHSSLISARPDATARPDAPTRPGAPAWPNAPARADAPACSDDSGCSTFLPVRILAGLVRFDWEVSGCIARLEGR